MEEIWVDIKGYEGFYQVSNQGRVRSVEREIIRVDGKKKTFKGKILNQQIRRGYYIVYLSKNGKTKTVRVHRLIAIAFIPNPENKPHIDHINTITTDNRIENLRWVTPKENRNNELTKKHNSESQKGKYVGENHPNYGKKHTKESKKKMSENRKGKCKGENNPNYGNRGELNSQSIKIVQLSLDGKLIKIWDSIGEASRNLGCDNSSISKCCRGKYSQHKGFKFMYYEDYLKLNEKGE